MNNFKLRNLAREIVGKGKITHSSAKKIQSLLSSSELSKLTEYLKVEMDKKTVKITVADVLSNKATESISNMFGGKRVLTTVDKVIGAGVKAQVYDMIYDLTIKSKINHLVAKLEEEL
ncbi:MAG: F0F1 ATP synthase subunit delta [Candidatus Levyibacteriota bacterium]